MACRQRRFAKPFRHGFKTVPQVTPQAPPPPCAQKRHFGACRVIAIHFYRAVDGGFVADQRHKTRHRKLVTRPVAMMRRVNTAVFRLEIFRAFGFCVAIIVL
jgi:hypothetical protein